MKTQSVPIGSISQDPANVRAHSERNIDSIVASLRRFGQQKPIVVDAAGIIRAGNGTYEAARRLDWTQIAVTRTGLTGSEATAYAIADNRTAELAAWDDVGLAETLRSLQSEGVPMADVGYTDDEVDALIESIGNDVLDAAADGKEYDESVEFQVDHCTCPSCGHTWPK